MAKSNPLAQGLNQLSPKQAAAQAEPAVRIVDLPQKGPQSRDGKVLVGGFFPPEVQIALKVLAAEERSTLQALLTEGINMVFAKRGRPEIAGLSSKQIKS
jgi:hypothetical protein